MSNLSLEQWGIVYGIFFSTLGVAWHIIRLWCNRLRLTIRVVRAYADSTTRYDDGYFQRWYLTVVVHNVSPGPVTVEHWGIDATKGKGPLVLEQTGLPANLSGYGKVEIDVLNPEIFEREPRVIYVQDGRGKRWKAKKKDVREAISAAQYAIEKNKTRSKEARGDRGATLDT